MGEVNIYLTELIEKNKLSYPEAEFFVDFAYDLYLNDTHDDEIEVIVTKEINQKLEDKQNAKLF